MTIHFQRDMDRLHRKILSMFALVEESVHRSVDGLFARNPDALREIEQRDDEINKHDVEIEEDCLKILALHQPVAVDLRRVTAVLKFTGELERVGDLAVNIAERTAGLANYSEPAIPPRMQEMADSALNLLHGAIDSFVELDAEAAKTVCADDDIVDDLNDEILTELQEIMQTSPHLVKPAMHLFSVTRHLERIGDHATNIAEGVVYLIDGEIIRHSVKPRSAV